MAVEQLITNNIDLWTSTIKKKSVTGRGSSKKIELYGIKKLRELILELAVRGKLVPQDPTDEPASELLKRIEAEKTQLIKDKKIKKPKELPEITDEEKPYELPIGWAWQRLGSIGYSQTGGTPKKSNPEHYGTDIPFIKPADISDRGMNYNNQGLSIEGTNCLGREAPENSILMVCIGTIGKCQLIDRKCAFNQQINSISPYVDIGEYILNVCRAKYFYNTAWDLSSSTTIAILNKGKWDTIPVAIAPIEEQQRIVDKVDELMVLCDQLESQTESSLEAHETLVQVLLATLTDSKNSEELNKNWQRVSEYFDTLFTTEQSIDQLKQTILQLAVMGKLVPQKSNDEPASVLLEKIAAEKAQLIKNKKIKKQKPLPPISDEEKPFELPDGWEWSCLGTLITLMDAGWSPACPPEPSPNNDMWGVLKTTAVQSMEYREFENKVLAVSKEPRPQYEVKVGDILITRAGPKNRVGVSCLVQSTRPKLMISDKIIRFHLVDMGMNERYISLCLNAGATADYLENAKSGMAESQMNISQDKLKLAPIPLCSLATQHKIISKVDSLFEICDQLKTNINNALTTQLNLTDAIVDSSI